MSVRAVFLLDAAMGVLMILLAIPMIRRKVKPNLWYGLRTRKTLSDESIWYPANHYAGKALLWAGASIAVASMALYWLAGTAPLTALFDELLIFALHLLVLFVPLTACVVASLLYMRRLEP